MAALAAAHLMPPAAHARAADSLLSRLESRLQRKRPA
jgi:hypothetical protein